VKPAPPENNRARAATWLRRGQALEAQGSLAALTEAVSAYDVTIALLHAEPLPGREAVRHELGVAWMNRGNALQKRATAAALADAVSAYNEAITLVRALPTGSDAVFRNCLGAAYLNRGQALLQLGDAASLAASICSQSEAVALLRTLPFEHIPAYRLNLAGALVNLANALLIDSDPAKFDAARAAANDALVLVTAREKTASEFAELGLKARRVLCETLGQLLFAAGANEVALSALASEASDAVDTGLALARHWENRGAPQFRPLAARLFRFGAQLYQLHQPQFLGEFLLENLDPAHSPGALPASEEFHAIAAEILARARRELGRRPVAHLDPAATARLLEISGSLAEADERLARLRREFLPDSSLSPVSAL
jgi:hypothetical protein